MAWTAKRTRIAGEVLRDSLARLADVAPTEIVVLSEESDWGLVGGDLLDAMQTVESEIPEATVDDKELVEA